MMLRRQVFQKEMKVTQLPELQEWTQLREWQRARMWQLQLMRRWMRRLRQYRLRMWLRQYKLYLLRHAAAEALKRLLHLWTAAGAHISQS
jgi:hypothetical protein